MTGGRRVRASIVASAMMLGAGAPAHAESGPTYTIPAFAGRFIGQAPPPRQPLTLWYRRPAAQWEEALPIGNGRLGAMVFGGVTEEHLTLNEDTLWSGGPYDPTNPDAFAALPRVRALIFEGKYGASKTLSAKALLSKRAH
jgi:alpha-L-fucosidase 2